MERGVRLAVNLIQRSVSDSTWRAYSQVWEKWESLLAQVGDCSSDDDFIVVLLYFIGLSFEDKVSVSGMGKRVAAVAFWCKMRGMSDITKSFLVRQALRGYRKRERIPDSRRPVSYALLVSLCAQVGRECVSAYEVLLFKAAFTLAFFGAFRISELVASSGKAVDGLRFHDVEVAAEGLVCWLRRSKTDQLGRGRKVVLFRLQDSEVCPVRCLEEFFAVRQRDGVGLLIHRDGRSLSRYQFLAVFRKCLRSMGLSEREFCTHSFRIGAATEAARWGLGDEVIKRIGRWESSRFRSYVRPGLVPRLGH